MKLTARSETWLHFALLSCVLLAALGTRLYKLGEESFWIDEAITWARASYDVPKLVADSIKRHHNPAYFLLIHFVLPFGDDETALRMPSAIFGFLKIFGVYLLGRIVAGRAAGLCAAVVLILNPAVLQYDQEARMYPMYGFGAVIALGGLLWLVTHPRAAALRLWRMRKDAQEPSIEASIEGASDAAKLATEIGRARAAWVAFVLGCIVTVYSHDTGVLFVTACSLVALAVLIARPEERLRFLPNWVIVNLVVIAAFAPWIPVLFQQTESFLTKPVPGEKTLGYVLATLQRTFLLGEESLALSLSVLALAGLGAFALRKRPLVCAALLILSVCGPLLLGVVGLERPMFYVRLMLWGALPFSVLVGIGLSALPRPWLVAGATLLLAFVGARQLHTHHYERYQHARWRDAVTKLSASYRPGSVVLATASREPRILRYYTERKTDPLPAFPYVRTSRARRKLDRSIEGAKVVWTVQAREHSTARDIRRALRKRGRRTEQHSYGGGVLVEKYEITTKAGRRSR
jgi:mannosyltransferase